jgi:hypothetical protein
MVGERISFRLKALQRGTLIVQFVRAVTHIQKRGRKFSMCACVCVLFVVFVCSLHGSPIVIWFWLRRPTNCASFLGRSKDLSLLQDTQMDSGATYHLSQWVKGRLSLDAWRHCCELNHLPHLVQRLRISGVVSPHSHVPSWLSQGLFCLYFTFMYWVGFICL